MLLKSLLKSIVMLGVGAALLSAQTLTTVQTFNSTIISASHSGTLYLGVNSQVSNATETNVSTLAGVAGTIASLNVLATAPGGSDTILVTARKNAADTTLTCTVSAAGTTCADATHSFTVVATDVVDYSLVYSTAVTGKVSVSTTFTNAVGTGVTYNNHTMFAGSAPTLSLCGTSPTNTNATDNAGTVTLGSGTVTACTLTFATAFTNAPTCIAFTNSNATALYPTTGPTTTAVTFGLTYTGATKFYYSCY